MPASAMKVCFLIAERRTIFCKDTLNICNFQIFRAVFFIEEWKVFLLLPSPRHFSTFSSDRQYKTKHHLHLQNTPNKNGRKNASLKSLT
jgi:hypothetical protein